MKKPIIVTLVLLLVLAFGTTAFADTQSCPIPELGLTADFPSDYILITRDTPANDPVFKKLGITHAAAMNQFNTGNIYLNAVSAENGDEIVVTMVPISLGDLGQMSDTTLMIFAETLVKQYETVNVTAIDYEIYQHAQTKFIRVHFNDNNGVEGMQYYTICNGQAINFTLRSYNGYISNDQETLIQNVVDSIVFDGMPATEPEGEDTEPFEYRDADSLAVFTVPANWKQEEMSKPREFIDAKFVSTKEAGCSIIYGSVDVWSELSSDEREGLTRQDLDNSYFTTEELAELLGCSDDQVETVTYSGNTYFQFQLTDSSSGFSITMTNLVLVRDGWLYSFQFLGTPDSKLYPQFEELVESASYVITVMVEPVVESTDEKNVLPDIDRIPPKTDTEPAIPLYVLICAGAAALLVIGLVIVICVSVSKKKRKSAPKTITNTQTSTTVPVCPVCGHQLASGTRCPMCGSNVTGQ